MLNLLFGNTLLPQSQLLHFAAANPNSVLRSPDELVWFTRDSMFKIVFNSNSSLYEPYSGFAYKTDPLDKAEPTEYYARVGGTSIAEVVGKLAACWQNDLAV